MFENSFKFCIKTYALENNVKRQTDAYTLNHKSE